MPSITISISFSYAHKLLGHSGKCQHLHGHNGRVIVCVSSAGLNELGFVTDFGDMKRRIKTWIDEYWDHNFICHPGEPLLDYFNPHRPPTKTEPPWRAPYVMKCGGNPTAENMAKELYEVVRMMYASECIKVSYITVYETDNCCATYSGG